MDSIAKKPHLRMSQLGRSLLLHSSAPVLRGLNAGLGLEDMDIVAIYSTQQLVAWIDSATLSFLDLEDRESGRTHMRGSEADFVNAKPDNILQLSGVFRAQLDRDVQCPEKRGGVHVVLGVVAGVVS